MTTLLALGLLMVFIGLSYGVSLLIYTKGEEYLPPLLIRICVGGTCVAGAVIVFGLFYALAESILST